MKTSEIITLNTLNTSEITFKDERLAKATQRITAIYNDAAKYADSKNREIAKILGDVFEKKAYEKDGFKSVADYASKVFGIAQNNAYALARAGKIYNDKNANPELQAMTPSKLAELNSVDLKDVTAAIEAGAINRDSTQKALREFADKVKSAKADDTPKVLDSFTARPCIPVINEEQMDTFNLPKTIDEWDDWFIGYVSNISPDSPVEIIKLPKAKVSPDVSKATISRQLYVNRGYSIVVEFSKYVAPKTKKTAKPKFTADELRAMLAELEAKE